MYFKLGLYTVSNTVLETMLTYFLDGLLQQIRFLSRKVCHQVINSLA